SSPVVQPEQPTTAPPPDQTQKSESVEKRAEPNWGRVKEKFKQLLDAYHKLVEFLKINRDQFIDTKSVDEAIHEAETFLGIAESYATDIETEDIYTARKLLQDAIATFSTITTKLSEAGESKLPNFATLAKIIRRISAITYNFMFALYPPAPELMAKSIKKAVEDEEDFDDYGLPIPIAVSTAIYNLIGDLDNAKKQVLYADNLDTKTKLRAETLIRDSIIWMAQLRDIAFYRIYDTSKAIASIAPIVLDNLTEAKSLIADAVPDATDKIQSAISTLKAIRNKLKVRGEAHPEPIPATIIAGSLSDLAEYDSSIATILKSALCPLCDPSKPIKKTIADPQLAKVLIKSLPGQLINPDDLPISVAISKALPESITVGQLRDLELPSFRYQITAIHADFWEAIDYLKANGFPSDVISEFIEVMTEAIDTIIENLAIAQSRLAEFPADTPVSSIPDDLKNLINIVASQARRLRHVAYIVDNMLLFPKRLKYPKKIKLTADDIRNWIEKLRAITSISEPDFVLIKSSIAQLTDLDDLPMPTTLSKIYYSDDMTLDYLVRYLYYLINFNRHNANHLLAAADALKKHDIDESLIEELREAIHKTSNAVFINVQTAFDRVLDFLKTTAAETPAASLPDDLKNLINIAYTQTFLIVDLLDEIITTVYITGEPFNDDVRNWIDTLVNIRSITEPTRILIKSLPDQPVDLDSISPLPIVKDENNLKVKHIYNFVHRSSRYIHSAVNHMFEIIDELKSEADIDKSLLEELRRAISETAENIIEDLKTIFDEIPIDVDSEAPATQMPDSFKDLVNLTQAKIDQFIDILQFIAIRSFRKPVSLTDADIKEAIEQIRNIPAMQRPVPAS
ncbi:MAG: hypothetical protein DRQ10_08930, partial [Candidatus Hydrothermota bacterium]